MKIGEKILMLREEKDMKQKELAELVGVTEATLSRYENGKREPKGEIVSRIAKALNVSTDYLLDSDNNLNKESETSSLELSKKEMLDIEKEAKKMISNIKNAKVVEFCGTPADEEDIEFLEMAYEKFLSDVRVYNKMKYTPKKYK